MAVDIKTLRIGSHVLIGGQRVRVCGITRRKIGYHATGKPGEHLRYARLNEVEPIAITSTQLKELGFVWHDSSSCWRKEVGDDVWLFVNGKEEQGFRFNLFPPYEKGVQEPTLYARYLHEIEGQLAYYGVELIKE